ncbi:MAG: exodeoxyribonuclease VII small subunit [Ruminobacter sp.]|jgi:exodeoxyribonuclease VII small subunit|uniref:Exodeoxyribonuclease 7 small subunit n=1 Tax=Ruminobacter amylophilus TaxID=867 RepID=A0A662ZGN1_9GAMM|nr:MULTISPECIES: exodeoxyribonuclease VII small subunit [Ruminobacter]MBQ3774791.1 exodeoxyribonuclease VII small subunit [Ruminobacter sp.]SFP19543.1 Exodeoxyribonuclease VII small subunit [Ruminobacter amylophilus]
MDNPQTLEQMLEQIDELVKKMESGKLPLSEHLSLFEQGVGLIKDCEKALKDAEGKVKILTDSQSLANGTKTGDDVVSDFNAGI